MSKIHSSINNKISKIIPYHQTFGSVVSPSGVSYARTNRSLDWLIETGVYPQYFFDNLRGKKVLDVGTGLGELVVDLNKQGVRAIGIDICGNSKNFERYPESFRVADATKTGFKRQSFDCVYSSFSVFHYDEDKAFKEKVLSEMKRIVKDGGKIRLGAINQSEIKDLAKAVGGLKVTGKSISQTDHRHWIELTKVH